MTELWADGGYAGPSWRARWPDTASVPEIVPGPKEARSFTVVYHRWVVERTFAWMSRCPRLAKHLERALASSLAWVQLAACRFLMRGVAREITP